MMMISAKKKKIFLYSLLVVVVILADRLTKSWALNVADEWHVNKFLSFALGFNRGINWGFFNGSDTHLFMLINTIVGLVLLGLAGYIMYLWKNNMPLLGQVLVLAGGVSNYWDRIFYGGVIDFIILKAGHWSWPAFNIADAIILLGLGIIIIKAYKQA